MTDNTKILAVHKSRNILLEILEVRGFNINDYKGFNINEIHTLFINKQLDMLVSNLKGKKVYIKYFLEKSIRPTNIHDMIDDLFNIEQLLTFEDDLIIIIKDEPNEALQKLQTSIFIHDKIFITIINIERLQFNILNHVLVPKHILLSKEEKEEIFGKFNINNKEDIPEISRYDPVSQVLGIRPGDLVEIQRPSKTSILNNFYRICSS